MAKTTKTQKTAAKTTTKTLTKSAIRYAKMKAGVAAAIAAAVTKPAPKVHPALAAAAVKKVKAAKSVKAKPERKPSMMSAAFELLKAGKTNAEVTEVLTKDFALPEKHKHYAGWFRAALVRKLTGQLTEAKGPAAVALKADIAKIRAANVHVVPAPTTEAVPA